MVDIFCSYSRKDASFVRRLYAALSERDRDTWVDWDDIPPTADWRSEIEAGVEAADAFVFVISPDSVVSEECSDELAHAVRRNKRLVPIVCRETPDHLVPAELRPLNWIFFREGDDFERGVETLVEALDTDLEWVRAHTRLLVRAIGWDAKGRDDSLLLRGSDLREAEEWLIGDNPERQPKLTPLQTQYIVASRKATTSRQRVVLGAVTLAFLVATGLALFAWLERNESERQRQIAVSRELAANAVAQLQMDPELSVLLATEAARMTPTTEAERHAASLGTEGDRHTDAIGDIAFGPDGRYLATASADGTARIWDPRTGQSRVLRGHEWWVTSARFSPDGQTIITSSADKSVRLWRVTTGELLVEMQGHGGGVIEAVFSPDGRRVLTASEDRSPRVWEVDSGRMLVELRGHGGGITGATFSPDGTRVATAGEDGTARIWDAGSGRQLAVLRGHSGPIWRSLFSPDGRYVLTAGTDGTSQIYVVRIDDLIALAGQRVTRSLTEDEQRQYLHRGE